MKYYATTIKNHIEKKITKLRSTGLQAQRILVTLPDLGKDPLMTVASTIQDYCTKDGDITLTLKIAQEASNSWDDPAAYQKASENDWLDKIGNLTHYRNAPVDGTFSLVVLCGVEKVTDTSSLADFYAITNDTIWSIELGRSFVPWLRIKLQNDGLEFPDKQINNLDRILKPLLIHGRTDLLGISSWLENLNFHSSSSIQDVHRLLLTNLHTFGLPNMTGFNLRAKTKKLGPYIDRAGDFFGYTDFMAPPKKKSALKTIDTVIEAYTKGEQIKGVDLDAPNIKGSYASGLEYLQGIKTYVETEDTQEKANLLGCDFVTLADKILKFRPTPQDSEETTKPETIKKLTGSPVEMVLFALWDSLGRTYKSNGINDSPRDILIEGLTFKHDVDTADDGSSLRNNDSAADCLHRLLGGVDEIINQQISFPDEETSITCTLLHENINYAHCKNAEPHFKFKVTLVLPEGKDKSYEYIWRLPDTHSFRLADALIFQTKLYQNAQKDDLHKLPVYHLPYYEELFCASSHEEMREIFLQGLQSQSSREQFYHNIFSPDLRGDNDPLQSPIRLLCETYAQFIITSNNHGLHHALFLEDTWIDLRQAYADALRQATPEDAVPSYLAGLLLRAFLIIPRRDSGWGTAWHTDPYESSAIVSILHPALLEMLKAQVAYQCSCFTYLLSEAQVSADKKKAYHHSKWQNLLELSQLQSPLNGVLYNESKNLCTDFFGERLLHRIGTLPENDIPASTRLLLKYTDTDEGEFSDTLLFQETKESAFIKTKMLEYLETHPHARDGISVAVYINQDIQPIIAAIHHYTKELSKPANTPNQFYLLDGNRRRPYAVNITVFSNSANDAGITTWIDQWQERWDAAETDSKYKHYKQCSLSIAHRLLDVQDTKHQDFQRLIHENFECDLAILYDFMVGDSAIAEFKSINHLDRTTHSLKFPLLEKNCCTIPIPTKKYRRTRIITKHQMELSSLHAKLMEGIQKQTPLPGGTLVLEGSDFQPWIGVVNALHQKSEWVLCVDPAMDDRLLKDSPTIGTTTREIIGFGSGIGGSGANNYTVSTEKFSLVDLRIRLSASLHSLLHESSWTKDDSLKLADGLINIGQKLSGLSIIRATGFNDQYIRDFTAYSLARQLLIPSTEGICDLLVSLDDYRHWFDIDELRPDLMWLCASLTSEGRLCLNIKLIECKLANSALKKYFPKAKQQIDSGLKKLMANFAPYASEDNNLDDQRPDRRYWWMQLHRLIASQTTLQNHTAELPIMLALEHLADGDYDITWDAGIFAFETSSSAREIHKAGNWITGTADSSFEALVIEIGMDRFKGVPLKQYPSFTWEDVQDLSTDHSRPSLDDIDACAPLHSDEAEEPPVTPPISSQHAVSAVSSTTETTLHSPSLETIPPLPQEPSDVSRPSSTTIEPSITLSPMTSAVPDRILLGHTIPGDQPIYWEFDHPSLGNRHMVIFGASGMGKTYAIQCLLNEMAKLGQHNLIIDYTHGFLPNQLEPGTKHHLSPIQHVVRNSPLPINPFLAQSQDAEGIFLEEKASDIGERIAGVFDQVYNIGDQQYALLYQAIVDGIEQYDSQMNLQNLLEILEKYIDDGYNKSTAQKLFSKIKPFVDSNPIGSGSTNMNWESIFTGGKTLCNIFQLAGLNQHTSRMVTEFIMWDLYGHLQAHGSKEAPKVLVLDEIQNLDHRDGSPLSKYLREGRKFGLSLIMATQIMSGMKKDEQDRIFGADHKLFFKPADTELRSFAQIAAMATREPATDWIEKLARLKKGECYSIGLSVNTDTGQTRRLARKIKITSLEDRGFHG